MAKALFSYDKQVVFATHDTELITRAEYAIDRTLVVDDHQVVFDGDPHEAVAFTQISSEPNTRLPKPDSYSNRSYCPNGVVVPLLALIAAQRHDSSDHCVDAVKHHLHIMPEFVGFRQ